MRQIAERYVTLVLRIGQHDPDYVDAYYGDPAWKPTGAPAPLDAVAADARALANDLNDLGTPDAADPLAALRFDYLSHQISAARFRLEMLQGGRFSFEEESERLYDAVAPRTPEFELQAVLDELDRLLPSGDSLLDRYDRFRARFVVPPDRLDRVFSAAIDAGRRRTREQLTLPPEETFTVEYVTDKSWSAYNWYLGRYTSLIQVNTDLPIAIDRALDLACHEGYPGHHVYHSLLEHTLVRSLGWVEFSVYPLFSPQALISEGTANFGIEVAFPHEERLAFEQDVLFPLAGLDPDTAEMFAVVQRLIARLSYAGNEAARRYLDGEIDREGAIEWLMRWALTSRDRARQRTHFFDQYRSYVINYNLGQDLVRAFIERQGGTADRPDARWRAFEQLLSSPRLPSGLR